MNFKIHSCCIFLKDIIHDSINNFNTSGRIFAAGKRNTIKLFELEGQTLNVKSFKIPNSFNSVVYKFFRKSKAKRSYEYATYLIENGILTPKPIAFYEKFNWFGLQESYYVSEHLLSDLTFRELVEDPNFPNHEIILRQFTQFCFQLHEKGIEFKDHSPGNTLIKKRANAVYDFYLVDLNRMAFHTAIPFALRMKNLSRLTPQKEMIAIMANEYAQLSGEAESLIFETLWKFTSEFQYRFNRKQALKKKYLGK